jgi:tRNA G46 methylase TrmB
MLHPFTAFLGYVYLLEERLIFADPWRVNSHNQKRLHIPP